MAFTLVAPVPLTETTVQLPNPTFGDSEAGTGEVTVYRTLDGARRTYVTSKGRRKLNWTFRLTRNKALELQAFYRSYNAKKVRITDHNGQVWLGNFTNNPFEIEMVKRGLPTRQGWPVGETSTATIEFEGVSETIFRDQTKIFTPLAGSVISDLSQMVGSESIFPDFGSLKHNWDANQIVAQHGDDLQTWQDNGRGENDLIGRIGDVANPLIDRTPTYIKSSVLMQGRPTVSFGDVQNQQGSTTAAMITTSDTSLFPNRRGTIFWVLATTINSQAYANYLLASKSPGKFDLGMATQALEEARETPEQPNDEIERAVWGLQNTQGTDLVEQVHFAGSSSILTPANIRYQPSLGASGNLTEAGVLLSDTGQAVIDTTIASDLANSLLAAANQSVTIAEADLQDALTRQATAVASNDPDQVVEAETQVAIAEQALVEAEAAAAAAEVRATEAETTKVQAEIDHAESIASLDETTLIEEDNAGLQGLSLATTNNGSITTLATGLYMLSRDKDDHLRFRMNGIEQSGVDIRNNPGRVGKFVVNDQFWVPAFNTKITGEWGQILVYEKALTTAQIEDVERYLRLRWGIVQGPVILEDDING